MRYFIIKHGFETADFIEIDETELEKAIYCQMTGKVGIFNNGTCRGSNIITIKEDWHKAMGWNRGYQLENEDFQYIQRDCKEYQGAIAEAKQNVMHRIDTGRTDLIGKITTQERLESPQNDAANLLADKFHI